MKSSIKYLFLFLLVQFYVACNSPQPTALVEDTDPIEIEVINKNLAEPTSFGLDSTGISDNPARFTNVITVAGIKYESNKDLFKTSFAQAVFFDRSKPVYVLNHRLIGYGTNTPGSVYFNNRRADIRQLVVKYSANKDTSLGFRYVLYRRAGLGDPFDFEFNSTVNFRFDPILSAPISFDITTPPEIFLNYKLSGQRANKNLALLLEWNAGNVKNFEILLSIGDIPLYRIKTADDGKFLIPVKLLQELAQKFDSINFTLTRKYEKRESSTFSELIVVSQSIFNISIELP
ncbi:MAG: hypothetical protein HXY50_06230 [Ignavibacteriaceae bacterium]|nr:hypothetical protein [Ignavibacteriaceae bacterium]